MNFDKPSREIVPSTSTQADPQSVPQPVPQPVPLRPLLPEGKNVDEVTLGEQASADDTVTKVDAAKVDVAKVDVAKVADLSEEPRLNTDKGPTEQGLDVQTLTQHTGSRRVRRRHHRRIFRPKRRGRPHRTISGGSR